MATVVEMQGEREPALALVRLRKKHIVDIASQAEYWLKCLLERSRHGHVCIRIDVKDGEVQRIRGGGESSGI